MNAPRVVLPPPCLPDGRWWLVLDPDEVTVTLAMMENTKIVASEVFRMDGGMRSGNLKIPGELKRVAGVINTRVMYLHQLRKELGPLVTVEMVHVGNVEMWRHD